MELERDIRWIDGNDSGARFKITHVDNKVGPKGIETTIYLSGVDTISDRKMSIWGENKNYLINFLTRNTDKWIGAEISVTFTKVGTQTHRRVVLVNEPGA